MSDIPRLRKVLWITLVVVIGGLAVFGLILLFLRSGGPIKIMSIVVALVLAYISYELVKSISRK